MKEDIRGMDEEKKARCLALLFEEYSKLYTWVYDMLEQDRKVLLMRKSHYLHSFHYKYSKIEKLKEKLEEMNLQLDPTTYP